MDFMEHAAALARRAVDSGDGGPFGAVVVKDGAIVGEGWNRVVGTNDPTAHAEIVAIRDACRRLGSFSLDGCEIYTTGEPCPMCLAAIHWARLAAVHHAQTRREAAAIGFDDERFYAALDQPEIPVLHEPHPAAAEAFRRWREKPDRVEY